MISFASVTPNLVVRDVARSLAFYRDVLGFTVGMHVPENEPFVFAELQRDGVPVFINDKAAAVEDHPEMASTPFGGTCTMFFVITGIDAFHAAVAPKANVVMALKNQFYGMREFSLTDPDGHLITFAERITPA